MGGKLNKRVLSPSSFMKVQSPIKIKDWSILNFSNHVQSDNEDFICASGSLTCHLHMYTYLNVCVPSPSLQIIFHAHFYKTQNMTPRGPRIRTVKTKNFEDLDRKCWSLHDKEPYPNRGENHIKGPHAEGS
jgi:hypothetical protein